MDRNKVLDLTLKFGIGFAIGSIIPLIGYKFSSEEIKDYFLITGASSLCVGAYLVVGSSIAKNYFNRKD